MKVNIISPTETWILNKFAQNMCDELLKMGIEAQISSSFDKSADINHYFTPNQIGYSEYTKVDSHTTFMITHVDSMMKLQQIVDATQSGGIGVCMSLETRDRLIASGVKRNRICYINPAQDGQIKPRKIVLGFTHRLYSDGRKNNSLILDVCEAISPDYFEFHIMGAGWDEIVKKMEEKGFKVVYFPEFDKAVYNKLIKNLDYYCYFGFDEGSMGFLDAVSAGVGTIVTPQGYHLDTPFYNITFPVNTLDDILDVLHKLETEKKKAVKFSELWTWKNYTLKHLEIWKYMTGSEELSVLLSNRNKYLDGIYSLLINDLDYDIGFKEFIASKLKNK